MQLTEALEIAEMSEPDAKDAYAALRVIGRHLASAVELDPETVAIAVGRDALDLLAGASEVLGELKTFAVVGRPTSPWQADVELSWINGPPLPGSPLLVVDRSISTGVTLRAVLGELRPPGELAAAVTVLVIKATAEGAGAILAEHPEVCLATVEGGWPPTGRMDVEIS